MLSTFHYSWNGEQGNPKGSPVVGVVFCAVIVQPELAGRHLVRLLLALIHWGRGGLQLLNNGRDVHLLTIFAFETWHGY